MHVKYFLSKEKQKVINDVRKLRNTPNMKIMNVRYDVNYATKEYQASVLYMYEKP